MDTIVFAFYGLAALLIIAGFVGIGVGLATGKLTLNRQLFVLTMLTAVIFALAGWMLPDLI
jgi:hypothetical protein